MRQEQSEPLPKRFETTLEETEKEDVTKYKIKEVKRKRKLEETK